MRKRERNLCFNFIGKEVDLIISRLALSWFRNEGSGEHFTCMTSLSNEKDSSRVANNWQGIRAESHPWKALSVCIITMTQEERNSWSRPGPMNVPGTSSSLDWQATCKVDKTIDARGLKPEWQPWVGFQSRLHSQTSGDFQHLAKNWERARGLGIRLHERGQTAMLCGWTDGTDDDSTSGVWK